jgi:hypothetical protein
MEIKPVESDWKTFRRRIPEWRERYLVKRNSEIAGLLIDESKTSTERFWEAEKKVGEVAKLLTDLLDGHSRSKMPWILLSMYGQKFIGDGDLKEFSAELHDWIRKLSNLSRQSES